MLALFFDNLREDEGWEARFSPTPDNANGGGGGSATGPIDVPSPASSPAHSGWARVRQTLPRHGGRPGTSPEDEAARVELRERLQSLGSVRRRATPVLFKDKLAQ